MQNFKVVSMCGSLDHVILNSIEDHSFEMSHGPVNTEPGTFRVSRWMPGFDPACLKMTTQVWIRLYGISLEFRKIRIYSILLQL